LFSPLGWTSSIKSSLFILFIQARLSCGCRFGDCPLPAGAWADQSHDPARYTSEVSSSIGEGMGALANACQQPASRIRQSWCPRLQLTGEGDFLHLILNAKLVLVLIEHRYVHLATVVCKLAAQGNVTDWSASVVVLTPAHSEWRVNRQAPRCLPKSAPSQRAVKGIATGTLVQRGDSLGSVTHFGNSTIPRTEAVRTSAKL
jgi:hypothetical protein